MKSLGFALFVASVTVPAYAVDVGVSVSIGQPGFYGQINLGNNLVPQLVYPQPIVITPPAVVVALPPLYLRVPPVHARDWRKHCNEYNACGRQVYFVQDEWYEKVYAPDYREHPETYRDERHEERHEKHDKKHDQGKHGRGRGHNKD